LLLIAFVKVKRVRQWSPSPGRGSTGTGPRNYKMYTGDDITPFLGM